MEVLLERVGIREWPNLNVRVAVVGATPCIQASMFFSNFTPGIVNRAERCEKVNNEIEVLP